MKNKKYKCRENISKFLYQAKSISTLMMVAEFPDCVPEEALRGIFWLQNDLLRKIEANYEKLLSE